MPASGTPDDDADETGQPLDDRPSAARGDAVPLLGNAELARLFQEIGDLVELKGELVFKAQAYRRAGDAIADSDVEVARAYREGHPPRLPGIGRAIDLKLAELADTGRLRFHERLRTEVPPSLLELLAVPGLGPRTVRELHLALGIRNLAELETAAREGRLTAMRGMGAKTAERILAGIAGLDGQSRRMRLGRAAEVIGGLLAALQGTPGLHSVIPAGSFRRRRETIGDVDLLVETDQPAAAVERLVGLPAVARVLGRGGAKASVELTGGPQVDLMVMAPGAAGSYLVHFTGSAAHNVRLRGIARERGWSLSEHGFGRLGKDGQPAVGEGAELRTFPTEGEVYGFLELPLIPPELREDGGEIEAARAGTLPRLIELADLRGDCHSHSDWSDGHLPIEVLAEAYRARGFAYQVLTDHTQSLGVARGLDPGRVEQQRRIIGELNERFAREEAAGTTPAGSGPEGFRLLHGCELEILPDGRLDFPDRLLASFDLVCASLHVGRSQPRSRLMDRYRAALQNPNVDVISHPSGRKIGSRDDLDLDWDALYQEAAATGTLLEINGSDERLDLDERRVRRAKSFGCRFVIDSDAHYRHELDNLVWGVAIARRGWLEPADVLNTRSRYDLQAFLADRSPR
ncbi:MAG: DNA polymerase/3'-5' exonuclease PolX [Candidatus Limnocylindrales bacterium]